MPLAADYLLLEAVWTIAIIALWVIWIFIVVWTLIDNFRRSDHSGCPLRGQLGVRSRQDPAPSIA